MSVDAMNWAYSIPKQEMGQAEHAVLVCLCWHHNPDKGCFPSRETIAARTHMSTRSVSRSLSKLEKNGWIERRSMGRRSSYFIHFQKRRGADVVPINRGQSVSSTGDRLSAVQETESFSQ